MAVSSTPPNPAKKISTSIRRHLLFGGFVILGLFGVGGRWAYTTQIAGAVVASGQVVVEGNVKKVQHPTGGVVSKLLVKDGDHVNAQDLLIKLDDTATRANLAIAENNAIELAIRKARLVAELESKPEFALPEVLQQQFDNPQIASIFERETSVLKSKLSSMTSQKGQLAERVNQLQEEVIGQQRQLDAKAEEASIAAQQLDAVLKLQEQNLAPKQHLNDLRREAARQRGEQGSIQANIAQIKGKIAETQLQIIQIDQDHLTEAGKELSDTESKLAESIQRRIEMQDLLNKTEIRAPQKGVVYELTVHAPGSVVGQGETIMNIVPEDETLAVEAKISPTDIDQIFVGQKADLRFTAFSQRTTPLAFGEVQFVSPDLITDQRSGASYYASRIRVVSGAEQLKLLPGMPAEAFIKTGDRTVLSYIAKPLADQLARAFKER
jgi:HlyD family secretion protein